MDIERGRTEAIDMAYAAAVNFNGSDILNQQEPMAEIGNINEVTNYTASTIPQATAPLTYVNDTEYEGLEEQLLTEDDATDEEIQEGEVADVTGKQSGDSSGNADKRWTIEPDVHTTDSRERQWTWTCNRQEAPRTLDTSVRDSIEAHTWTMTTTTYYKPQQMRTSFSLLSLNNTTASCPPDAIRMDNSRWYKQDA